MAKVVAIVQARTTSTRFPMKILAGIGGRPMLSHVLERAAAIQGVDQVVLAVPENDVSMVSHLWPHVYGGSEKDVLGRYAEAAEKYEADIIIRITGDCPLLPSNMVSPILKGITAAGRFYLPWCQPYVQVADGWDFEVFSMGVLIEADIHAKKLQREHVTTWMRENYEEPVVKYDCDWTPLKCSVDTVEDLERVKKIYDCLEDKTDFSHLATWKAWEAAGRP